MNKSIMSTAGAILFLCLASAFSPFWMNQCSHRLTEREMKLLLQSSYAADRNADETIRRTEWLRNLYVPCGVGDADPKEKSDIANNYAGLFEDQLYLLPLPALRIDLDHIHLDGSTPKYYFQAYTFFNVPAFCVRSILPGRLLEFYDFRCPTVQ